mmetsp:Transcript_5328/g.9214  ORF Transcript_5328/g.9214 Transcript_5328/m.9214 type:complete len:551 (-) Transcript_5328:681-2333(-)
MAPADVSTVELEKEASLKTAESSRPGNVMPQFTVPVDSEHKSKTIRIFSLGQPHMMAFHLSWFAFFITFLATFAPAALLPPIRDNLGATKWDLGNAGVASVCGAVACRMFMGVVLDIIGPRMGTASTLLMVAPAVFCMSLVETAGAFTAVRLFIGCSLCMFVCCSFWVGSMFNVRIVGTANAVAAGWGNMGGGACSLIMPSIYKSITTYGVPGFSAWRFSFFIPGGLFIVVGVVVLMYGVDAPDGDYRDLKASGAMSKGSGNFVRVLKCGVLNYRTWVMAMLYGYSFGVELTVDNVIVYYLYDNFQMDLVTAGAIGGLFGLMNLFSRATGGMLSDLCASRFGMRGRLWVLWILQTLGGVSCLVMGHVDYSEGGTIAAMLIFSIFCQQACGATFGVVPFVSRRAYGVVSGAVGAGGNVGAIITQTIFFLGATYSPVFTTAEGFRWMGVMIMCLTLLLFTMQWPMWGSMLTAGNEEYAEEDYYLQEWTAEEVAQGLHGGSMRFAMESRSQRGVKSTPAGQLSAAAINATTGMSNNEHSVHGAKVNDLKLPTA